MIISVKTTGLLGQYLPPGSSRNRGDVELPDNSSARDLLNTLAIPDDGQCFVSINGSMLQSHELDTTVISSDDQVVLMAPIRAG